MVDRSSLENCRPARVRGFESPSLLQIFIFPACLSLAEEELSQSAEANYGGF